MYIGGELGSTLGRMFVNWKLIHAFDFVLLANSRTLLFFIRSHLLSLSLSHISTASHRGTHYRTTDDSPHALWHRSYRTSSPIPGTQPWYSSCLPYDDSGR